MNKLMYRFVYTTKKKQDACYTGITRDAGADSFIPTVCFASLLKRFSIHILPRAIPWVLKEVLLKAKHSDY